MSTVELIEQWLEKCDLAHQAQTRYDQDPTPTNYSRLKCYEFHTEYPKGH